MLKDIPAKFLRAYLSGSIKWVPYNRLASFPAFIVLGFKFETCLSLLLFSYTTIDNDERSYVIFSSFKCKRVFLEWLIIDLKFPYHKQTLYMFCDCHVIAMFFTFKHWLWYKDQRFELAVWRVNIMCTLFR